jgi:hypothetical protein
MISLDRCFFEVHRAGQANLSALHVPWLRNVGLNGFGGDEKAIMVFFVCGEWLKNFVAGWIELSITSSIIFLELYHFAFIAFLPLRSLFFQCWRRGMQRNVEEKSSRQTRKPVSIMLGGDLR